MDDTEVVSILTALVDTCENAQKTFQIAAEKIQNAEFRRIFTIFSHQRGQFARELQAEVDRLRGPSTGDLDNFTLAGHKEPLEDLLAALPGIRDEASIISECEQSEAGGVIQYQEALKTNLAPDIHYVLKRQYMEIKDAYDRIRILQRAA